MSVFKKASEYGKLTLNPHRDHPPSYKNVIIRPICKRKDFISIIDSESCEN